MDLIQGAGPYARDVAWFAAERAIASAALSDPPVRSVLDAARSPRTPDTIGQRRRLEELVQRLDDEYWNASDADPQDEARALVAFRRARAASALLAALGPDEAEAAIDAVYEAYHALPEDEADSFVDEAKDKLRHHHGLP